MFGRQYLSSISSISRWNAILQRSQQRIGNHIGVKLVYQPGTLKEINNTGSFPKQIGVDLKHTLKDFGILRPRRGCRSGKRVQLRLRNKTDFICPIRCVNTTSTFKYQQSTTQWSRNSKRPPNLNLVQIHCVNTHINTANSTNFRNSERKITFSLLNAQSVRNKTANIMDYIVERKVDLLAITETWLKSNDDAVKAECLPSTYKISDYPRLNRSGGGLALIHRDDISVQEKEAGEKESFEFAEWKLATKTSKVSLILVYRPPYSTKHPVTTKVFFSEFSELLESVVLRPNPIIICGDFNIHVDEHDDPDAKRLDDLLQSMGLQQKVCVPTHKSGHTLDLLITRKYDTLVCSTPIADEHLSDHCSVLCCLNNPKPKSTVKEISYRKLKDINLKSFKDDISSSALIAKTPTQLEDILECYNTTLSAILDKHAPVNKKILTIRPRVPWYNQEIRSAKRLRRQAEKQWRSVKSEQNRQEFKKHRNRTTYLMNKFRKEFYTNFVNEHSHNQRKLFIATKSLLNMNTDRPLPPCEDKTSLANDFGEYFINKIRKIRSQMDETNTSGEEDEPCLINTVLCIFNPVTEDTVKEIIKGSPSKSCELDPIPTGLVKDCIDVLLPIITKIINLSLESGVFPGIFKKAIVKPVLKKAGLPLVPQNYRPVSNLSYVSKLLEKTVFNQITSYLNTNNLQPINQSAYRKCHSVETALLKVKNDILLNMDEQKVTLLVLLDLSAAFDTIDHGILIRRLKSSFGLSDKVLDWFSTYLKDRFQCVSINGTKSNNFHTEFGVPQGSCLGPLLFTLYSSKLFQIIKDHLPLAHCFADDTQLYFSFKPNCDQNQHQAISTMESCISAIKSWMTTDKLQLNDSKTEFLIIGSRQQLLKVNINSISIGDAKILPSSAVRNLGSWFDCNMTMEQHVTKLCGAAFYYIYNIRRIRKYLSKAVTESLIHAFVTSRVDFCNSLLYGMPSTVIKKIQRVQNAAARLITKSSKFDHITPLLKELHWLPIRYRIQFKVIILTYKCVHEIAPQYLQDLIKPQSQSKYNLRNRDSHLLETPSGITKSTMGDRSFKMAAPHLWNELPLKLRKITDISLFKQSLKTYLFTLAFN